MACTRTPLVRHGVVRAACRRWLGHMRGDAGRVIRLLSQPAVVGRVVGIAELTAVLKQNIGHIGHAKHRLVPLDFGIEDMLVRCTGGVVGHRQVTDALLLSAAMRNGARLLTFDTGLRQLLATEAERSKHLIVLR